MLVDEASQFSRNIGLLKIGNDQRLPAREKLREQVAAYSLASKVDKRYQHLHEPAGVL